MTVRKCFFFDIVFESAPNLPRVKHVDVNVNVWVYQRLVNL
jgi:hypothetical protein